MDYMQITEVECSDWVLNTEGINMGGLKELVKTLRGDYDNPDPPAE